MKIDEYIRTRLTNQIIKEGNKEGAIRTKDEVEGLVEWKVGQLADKLVELLDSH